MTQNVFYTELVCMARPSQTVPVIAGHLGWKGHPFSSAPPAYRWDGLASQTNTEYDTCFTHLTIFMYMELHDYIYMSCAQLITIGYMLMHTIMDLYNEYIL